jgi:site-specific DNA-methyltransferase (adenine-specific)
MAVARFEAEAGAAQFALELAQGDERRVVVELDGGVVAVEFNGDMPDAAAILQPTDDALGAGGVLGLIAGTAGWKTCGSQGHGRMILLVGSEFARGGAVRYNRPTLTETHMQLNDIAAGDCLETMAAWPEGSVDLVFADPPYNIGYKYDQYEDKRDDHEYIEWTEKWIDGCARLLKPSGSMYILIGDEYAAEVRMHLKKLERERKLVFRNWIVWHYTFGQNCKVMFNRSHAHLFYCVGTAAFATWNIKKGLPFTFNREAIAVASARQTTYGDARANPGGKLPDDTWYLRPQQASDCIDHNVAVNYFGPDEDTWYLSRLCGTFKERVGWHPCQLPEALLERIVKVSSNEGDVVFDPFTGSGTTLAVAARLGRQWLGCELSSEYAAKAKQRIEHAAQTGTALQTTLLDKGIERGKPKKKAEPHRSPHLKGTRRTSGGPRPIDEMESLLPGMAGD